MFLVTISFILSCCLRPEDITWVHLVKSFVCTTELFSSIVLEFSELEEFMREEFIFCDEELEEDKSQS